jgi:hypothetical protein
MQEQPSGAEVLRRAGPRDIEFRVHALRAEKPELDRDRELNAGELALF